MRFSKFNFVGLLGAALQVILIQALTKFGRLSIIAATLIAVECALLHNFFWHQRFTWSDRRSAGFSQSTLRLLRFQAANGTVSLFGNTFLMHWFVDGLGIPVIPSTLASIALCSLANFYAADRWVYAKTSVATLSMPKFCKPSGRGSEER